MRKNDSLEGKSLYGLPMHAETRSDGGHSPPYEAVGADL
jgi:hypothetical protein